MRIKFTGFVDIPDGDVDSHCDVDHAVLHEMDKALLKGVNADDVFEKLSLTWEETKIPTK